MGQYLFRASYTQKGIAGILKEGGTERTRAVEAMVASAGGKVICQFWAFGETDYILIAQLADNVAAASLASTVAATGIAGITTTVLLTADEIDDAARRHPAYRAPGA